MKKKNNKWQRIKENQKTGTKPESNYAKKKHRGIYSRLKEKVENNENIQS